MMASAELDEFVDVFAVTGFLGSGKTTLIKALLDSGRGVETAVLVNEFGEIGIDDAILADAGDGIVELQNGCVCCRVGSNVEETLRSLFMARVRGHVSPFRRLFVETSGISDPIDFLGTMHARPVREMRYLMQGTIATFDCQFGEDSLQDRSEAGTQLAAADCVVLTKSDIAEGVHDRIAAILAACNPGVPILSSQNGLNDSAEPVLDLAGAAIPMSPAASAFRAVSAVSGPARHAGVRSISLVLDGAVDWQKLVSAIKELAAFKPAKLLRLKGILSVAGMDAPIVVHGVRDVLYPPSQLAEWPFARGESRIVLIYANDDADMFAQAARQLLAATLASHARQERIRAA